MPALSVVSSPDPLAQHEAERTLVMRDMAEVDRRRARLAEAESAKGDAERALNDLGGREVDMVKQWAAGGCEGEQPVPDTAARARLTARIAEATRAAEVARLASVDLDARPAGFKGGSVRSPGRCSRRSSRPCWRSSRGSRGRPWTRCARKARTCCN